MNGYHDIHCPFCGIVSNPLEIKFSISEFVEEIFNQRLDEKYNDGILGEIDTDYINLILDNDYLWDMSVGDILNCYVGDMFVLSGENIVKRFGQSAVEQLRSISPEEIEEVSSSTNVNDAIQNTPRVKALVEEILKNVSPERLMRAEIQREDRDIAVLNLLEYAMNGKTLFKIHLKVEADTDDMGNIINKDIRSVEGVNSGRIICKSKRCPSCGNELSKMAGKYEEKIISFIGSPAAGKSAYLAAAVNKLLTVGHSEYGIEVIFDFQSSDYISFNEACLFPYSRGFAITKTNQDTFPQISIALKNSLSGKTYLYTFVDIPGETFIDENGCNVNDILTNRRIIKHADVIWYCVSAKQFFASHMGILDLVKTNDKIENQEMSDLKILGANTIKFASEMFASGEKTPAVALILTKSDLLAEFIADHVFSGDHEANRAIKKDYFQYICSAPQNHNSFYNEDYDYYDGEPNTLGYMHDRRFIYRKFLNNATRVSDFINKHGESDTGIFMGNVQTAFNKNECICFSEASYGRSPVERYSMDTAVRYILDNKSRITPRDFEALKIIFGEAELEAFERGDGKLPIIKEKNYVTAVQDLYKKLNPVYPFGIMTILEWTFAYTGFVECVEYTNNGSWNVVPVRGAAFDKLRSCLTLESPATGNITENTLVDNNYNDDSGSNSNESGGGGFFKRIFGRK